jgi:diacylglycerol kinase family enzyme
MEAAMEGERGEGWRGVTATASQELTSRHDTLFCCRFGFIPGGSGNNVSRTLGTINVEKAARWCSGGSAKEVRGGERGRSQTNEC